MSARPVRQVCIADVRGPRFYTHTDFPLAIGIGPDSGVCIGDPEPSSIVAFLVFLTDRVRVELQDRGGLIRVNGQLPVQHQALEHDDRLQVGDSTFHVEHIGDTFSLSLHEDPSLAPSQPRLAGHGELIEPVAPATEARKQRGKKRPGVLGWAAALIFSALALVLLHVFTAKSLLIEIYPEPEQMTLHGKIWPLRIQGRYLVQPGEYSLEVEKAGYRPLKRKIQVTRQASQALAFTLIKQPGYLNLTSLPEQGVSITINHKAYGTTPLENLELPAGTYVLQASADRYQPYATQLVIEGKQVSQDLHIQLQPGWSAVSIDSRPQAAEVWLNGSLEGTTPLKRDLLAGLYSLELRHPDYLPYRTDFLVNANEPLVLPTAELFGSKSQLVITSIPPQATVYAAGKELGRTPLTARLHPNAEHSITLAKPGYRSSQQAVLMKPGEKQTLTIHLEAILGTVIVHADPEGSEVFVQDRLAGQGTVKLTLPSTPQRLEVRKPGYEIHRQLITPAPGAPQVIHVHLHRKARPAVPQAPERIRTSQAQELVLIRGGTFAMGAPRREQGRRTNETQHTVTLQKPFYVSTTEVTNARFAAFMPSHHSGAYRGHDLSAPDLPVANVRWEDAARYCNWLSEREGLESVYQERNGTWVAKKPLPSGYRLPTESEWEWVARVRQDGTLKKYAWGSEFPPVERFGNYADRSAAGILSATIGDYDDGFAAASPVGSFEANSLGIFDLDGNVAEWCHDYHSVYPALSEESYVDPTGPESGSKHVIRGASWMRSTLANTRLSYRDQDNTPRMDVGFRIARYPD
ncbi:MAG: PEGA domain-containing protein [Gammaproteobacteria bacterium]|nr:PEGA domain-containing protein [Gammaproteobacteria bacterium]